ncbi:MAG: sigma-70 family RNA polymerase sigma factor [Candidatus Heteroscillospira sp.]
MERDEEKRIIARVLGGDTEAFEALVIENQTLVYNLALRMVGNEQDAGDIAQDAFLRAYRSLENFRGDSKFSVWLYRLTSNICLDFLRARRRGKIVSLSRFSEDEDESIELEIPDESMAPHAQFEKKELHEALNLALQSLPDEQREILLLREVSGLSYDEIAAALSLEAGTVKSRIFRARKKLCNILMRDGNFSAYASSNRAKGV